MKWALLPARYCQDRARNHSGFSGQCQNARAGAIALSLAILLLAAAVTSAQAAAQEADVPRIHKDYLAVEQPASGGTEWKANFRRCEMDKWFYRNKDAYEFSEVGSLLVSIKPEDIPAIEKGIAILKKCSKFWTCVRERDAGKKRHCYLPRR